MKLLVRLCGLASAAVAFGCGDGRVTAPDPPRNAPMSSPPGTPVLPLMLSVLDPVRDHTGHIDVVGMVMRFSNATGQYEIVLTAAAPHPFVGAFVINIGLFNPDVGTTARNPSSFDDVSNIFDLRTPTTTMTLKGVDPSLRAWAIGHRVFTNSLAGTGNPDGTSLFRSSVADLPFDAPFLAEDVIAFEDLAQPAIIEAAPSSRIHALFQTRGLRSPRRRSRHAAFASIAAFRPV